MADFRKTPGEAKTLRRTDKHLRTGVLAALGGAAAGLVLAFALRGEPPRSGGEAMALEITTPAPQLKPVPAPTLTPAPAPVSPPVPTAAAADASAGAPMVAIVIDDVGLNRARTDDIIALNAPLTLSFLTYAENLPAQARAARAAGHETMVHVAMEPISRDADPGPGALLTSHSEAEILRRLRSGLGRFEGAAGVNNHMGSKFTADSASLMTVMAELRARGLYFLDSRTSARSAAADVASEFGVRFAVRDVFLDDAADTKTAAERLAETEALARRRGHAVAIGHPRARTLAALRAWIPGARARGVVIAPVSAVIRRLEAGQGG